jgi:hypothetical protein
MTLGTKRQDDRGAALFDEKRFTDEAILVGDRARSYECPYCHKLQFIAELMRGSIIETKCTRRSCRRFLRFQSL